MTTEPTAGQLGIVVYLILSHENPRQILRLVSRLEAGDPDCQILVQHDDARCPLDPGAYVNHPRVHFMAPTPRRRWGRYSLVESLLVSLRWALTHLEFDWLTVLTGQDYPLESPMSFRAQLDRARCDAFVIASPVLRERPSSGDSPALYTHARYYYRWYEIPPWMMAWTTRSPRVTRHVRGVQRRLSFAQPLVFLWSLSRDGGDMIGFRRIRLPFDDTFKCYFGSGSQRLTISHRAANVIDRFTRERTDVVRLYQRSMIPDESLPVTILCNSPELRICRETHHYNRRTELAAAHVTILRREDLDTALASGKPFAGKFDDRVDSDVLDLLDELIELSGRSGSEISADTHGPRAGSQPVSADRSPREGMSRGPSE